MIDWTRVEDLRSEVGEEDFLEIARLFLDEVEATLRDLAGAGAPAGMADMFHGLKGSALNLGFRDLADLSGAAEREPSGADIGKLCDLFRQAREHLCARYPELSD